MPHLRAEMSFWLLFFAILSPSHVYSQYFPPPLEGITVVKSQFHEGVKISYKEPGICETTEGVKSYSGYVHMAPNTVDEDGELQNYPINTFFWFFESRKDPHNAPLSIWLNGGPGGSSLVGALEENGPCFVSDDSNSTYLNPWAWNNEVNMLYIDQPVQVGYSYDTLFNGTLTYSGDDDYNITLSDFPDGVPEQNHTFLVGTFASQNLTYTANSSVHAAHALWHFLQTFLEEFPAYKPHDEKVSLWTESYGGKYGPSFTHFFQTQNEKISNGTICAPGAHYMHLDTLGIINGCVDDIFLQPSYPSFAFNNTYGIQALNRSAYEEQMHELERPGGLLDKIRECQQMAKEADPEEHGDVKRVNQFCRRIANETEGKISAPFFQTKKYGAYDITHPLADPFPKHYYIGYLNRHWVQKALGVPVNYTFYSSVVAKAFLGTGDTIKGGMIEDIEYVLEDGIKVALVYGDRDWICNWINGEETSLYLNHTSSEGFRAAGYTPIEITPFYSGGQVRQYGNLSFSRVYQAGHMVPAYQPEVAYKIFMRTMFNKDVATGVQDIRDNYSTEGPSSTWHIQNDVLSSPDPECYILSPDSCTEEQYAMVKNNTAIIKDYKVVGYLADEKEVMFGENSNAFVLHRPEGQKILSPHV